MFTPWKYPTTVRQYAEDPTHVAWDDSNNYNELFYPDRARLRTKTELFRISNYTARDITSTTNYLETSGYNFDIGNMLVMGIQVRLVSRRGGRIMDECVALSGNGEIRGVNKADVLLDPEKFYGGVEDMWGLTLPDSFFADPSFGVTLRFQSHISTPHRDAMFIDSIAIRLNLA